MELEELRLLHADLRDRYAEVRAAAEARVAERRYTRGWRVENVSPYHFERGGMPRPRLARKVPPPYVATEHGLDATGAVIMVRDVDLWTLGDEWYRVDDERSVAYTTWEPPGAPWRITGVRVHLQRFAGGRPEATGTLITQDHDDESWSIERYVHDDQGRLIEITTSRSATDEHRSLQGPRVEHLSYDERRKLRLVQVVQDGQEWTTYVKLERPLKKELEALAEDVAAHLAAVLERVDGDVRALALQYSQGQYDIAFSPVLLHDSDWQRWIDDPLEDALNPAEWLHEDEVALPPELDDRRRLLQVALTSKGTDGRAWVLDVARRINARRPDDPFTYAVDPAGDRFDADFSASLATDRRKQVERPASRP